MSIECGECGREWTQYELKCVVEVVGEIDEEGIGGRVGIRRDGAIDFVLVECPACWVPRYCGRCEGKRTFVDVTPARPDTKRVFRCSCGNTIERDA
tara:strand:- start:910 stop:1197 length:288 start_codon:yes stop_codon:yes gene_type:complete